MSNSERIQELTEKLHNLEQRMVANWERPIFEVAREALLQEISILGRQAARWDQMIPPPVFARAS